MHLALAAMAFLPLAAPAAAQETDTAGVPAIAIAELAARSAVVVEYTLKVDKGEVPRRVGAPMRCPTCGSYHAQENGEELIAEDRPLEAPGLLIAADRVISPDVQIEERFIKGIAVRRGERIVAAGVARYAAKEPAVILELAEPLDGQPLSFSAGAGSPHFTVTQSEKDGVWEIRVAPFGGGAAIAPGEAAAIPMPPFALILDAQGGPAGMSLSARLSGSSWRGSPEAWESVAAGDRRLLLDKLKGVADRGILAVTLNFRSPRNAGERFQRMRYTPDDEEEEGPTELHAPGILIDEKRVLVLSSLGARQTARLDRVRVKASAGAPLAARFVATLTDYGALVVDLEAPLAGAIAVSEAPIRTLRGEFLLAARIRVIGEERVETFSHERLSDFEIGWKRSIYPSIRGDAENLFLFTTQGELAALPIRRRAKAGVADRWSSRMDSPALTSALQLKAPLSDLAAHSNPSIVPLPEGEEDRVAWLGVVLQPLGQELARANKIAELTRDGETGALVTFVYPESPAAAAGIEAGAVLLRIRAEGHPRPIDVLVEDHESGFDSGFPWAELDEIPEEYFDHLPPPWPPLDDAFSQLLTDLGFGTKYAADFVIDGVQSTKELAVVQSPPHFETAARFKSQALGITVRDLTFEVRRHLQKTAGDPGVIVAKIEPGSKSSVAGLRPYEIVTEVNGQPVRDVQSFSRLLEDQKELRLQVERMTQGRVVRIQTE